MAFRCKFESTRKNNLIVTLLKSSMQYGHMIMCLVTSVCICAYLLPFIQDVQSHVTYTSVMLGLFSTCIQFLLTWDFASLCPFLN